MNKTKNSKVTNIDQFYEFCYTNNKLTEDDVDKLLILAAMNNGEITDAALRGYLPIAWAACVRIAQAMDAGGVAKYVDQFTEPIAHLPLEDRQGLWKVS
jgi:hypothetical protein